MRGAARGLPPELPLSRAATLIDGAPSALRRRRATAAPESPGSRRAGGRWRLSTSRAFVALAATTALVVGASYLAWDRGAGAPGSRSHGFAAEENQREVGRLIGALEGEVAATPSAARLTELSQLYLLRARDHGDLQDYLQAEAAITRALAMAPADLEARTLAASVRYSMHDFAGALTAAQGVLAEEPDNFGALATAGDAHLELGHYAEAAAVYAKLGSGKPAASVDVRLARLAYLQGRPEEALRLAGVAEDRARATAFGGTALAFYEAYVGQVELDTGRYDAAVRSFTEALEEAPRYPAAMAGLARARAGQGRTGDAIRRFEEAVAILPQPDTLTELGDLYQVEAKPERAATQYGTVEVIATLAKLNRQVYNRPLALFYADHDLKVDEALRLTEAELEVRKDVFGYDAYAWALYRNGRLPEAREASDRALAQHTKDARLLYHAGMISKALGDTARARGELGAALAISPRFDPLQAPRAKAALASVSRPG